MRNFSRNFRRNNSKTVIQNRKTKCKPNFKDEILCSKTINHTHNDFLNNP